jgi:dTDP-4-dehydrorhamnose reductase
VRLIHISTDCVFSGKKGNYSESDTPDATDLYGRTKVLGEVTDESALTIRTSIIGRELSGCSGLVEWFLSQRGRNVKGFRNAIFSGFTTTALSQIVATIVEQHRKMQGLWHVASSPISKFDLLSQIAAASNLNIDVEPDEEFCCDRSLDGRAFAAKTGIVAPDWNQMINSLVREFDKYERYRQAA